MTTVTRLLDYFAPDNYDLSLTLDAKERRFEGRVMIRGSVQKGADHIGLHAKNLTILTASIDDQPAEFTAGKDDEIEIKNDQFSEGEHSVEVTFQGIITDQMHGLYPCYYEHDGVKKELFATQFESHHAREVFPCIDEPAAKATFDLQLATDTGYTVLSNMPVKATVLDSDRQITTFDTTPRMSTYLLAFVVGDMQKKTAQTKGGVEVNIWATHAQPANSLDFALDIAVRSIEFYDDYFGTAYPLPKSDHVALPDFSSGAMENWGLITYRESTLLGNAETTSIASLHYIATVIAHELAHQWFGNLVTMEWWNDLWLNESFATLMEYIAVDALHPEWNIWLDFATHESVMALRRDSIDGVQPVQVDVNHPDEISTLFDGAIVYAKGARLLRMIQHYIGHDAFRAGLKQYFAKHAYTNTIGNDLWNALEQTSGKEITSIMNTWISQPGYPVVSVARNNGELTLSQQQFFIGPHEKSDKTWPVPLDADSSDTPQLLNDPSVTFASTNPIRLNRSDSAHFITNYDEQSRTHLLDQVADGSLDTIGRVQLLDEATLLARGGVITSDQLIPLVQAYKDETLEPVWDMIGMALGELRKFIEDNKDAEAKLRQLSATIASKEYARLGWTPQPDESEEDTKLRSTIIGLTLYGEAPDALETAKKLYDTTPLDQLDPELRALVISSVARYGDGAVVDTLLEAYKTTQSPDLKQDICIGITSTRVPEKIDQLLDGMKDPAIVKPQDVFRWFVYLIRGRDSRDKAWQWIRDNWDWVEQTFAGDKSYDDFPRYGASGLVTRAQLEEYKAFFDPKKNIPALARTITLGISEIEGRVTLIERDKAAVQKALLDI
jgi:aminopeptidase N